MAIMNKRERRQDLPVCRDLARQQVHARLRDLVKASEAGDRRRLKRLCRAHFGAPIVRLDAAYRVLGGERPSYEEANHLAGQVNPFSPCRAPVRWWREPKRRGGFRVVCALPPALRADNLIVKDVLEAQFRPGDHIYDWKGRGRDREARNIKAALEQGYRYVLQGDLRDAFQSVRVEALYDLPLPATVIRYALDYRSMVLTHAPEKEVLPGLASGELPLSEGLYGTLPRPYGPRGLLQGAPASNLVLAWLLNGMPGVLPPGCMPFLLTDNVLVAAHTEDECRRAEQTLLRYFAEHPAGPFVLGSSEIVSAQEDFERAGYEYIKVGRDSVEIAPDGLNLYRMYSSFYEAVQNDAKAGRRVPTGSLQSLRRKLSGFRAMTDLEGFWISQVEHMFGDLMEATWRRDDGIEPSHIDAG